MCPDEKQIYIERDVNIHLENKKKSRAFFWFIWILYAMVYTTKNCYNGAMASIVAEGVLTKAQTGFISAMFYVVYTPLQIVGGVFADKYSPERMIKIGLVGAAIANTVIFFNQNYYVMLAAWMFNAAAQFAVWPAVFKIISSQLVRSDRKKMTFYISFSATAGLVMSYLIAALVSEWKYNFFISALALLVFALGLHIFDKYLNPYMKWDKEEHINHSSEVIKSNLSTSQIFTKSGFYFVLISTVISIIVSQSRATLSPIMFVENYKNVTPFLGNILNIVLIVAGFLGTIISQKVIANLKNEVVGMIVTFALMIPFQVICMAVGSIPIWMMVSSLSVITALESTGTLLRNYYSINFAKYGKSGLAAGVLNAAMSFSFFLAYYVMPIIVEKFGWKTFISLWPIMIAVSAIVICFIVKRVKNFKAQ